MPEALLTIAITGNLVLLGIVKYTYPIGDSTEALIERPMAVPQLLAPLGMSFFTYHAISYLVDIYQRQGRSSTRTRFRPRSICCSSHC